MTESTGKAIAINGANGFIGTHIVRELLDRGENPVCILREGEPAQDIQLLESWGAKIIQLDTDKRDDSLEKALQGCDRLIHLIGSIAPPKGTSLEQLQTGLAQFFFASAKKAGIKKVVMVTALGCGPQAASEYHRTKWLAEEEIKKTGLTYVILRPSFVVGRIVGHRDSKLLRRFITLIETKNKVPLILGGKNKVQPIFIGDLARAFASAAIESTWDNSILEVAGKDTTTTRGMVEVIMDVVGIKKGFTSIPGPLAWIIACLCETFQNVPLLSRDQLKISKINGNLEKNDLVEKMGINPLSLRESLQFYAPKKETAGV